MCSTVLISVYTTASVYTLPYAPLEVQLLSVTTQLTLLPISPSPDTPSLLVTIALFSVSVFVFVWFVHLLYYFILFMFLLTVNSTHELGPLVDLKIPANKTRWILKNLNFSTRYKFYFYAQTAAGSGIQITEEAITTVDEGKLGMYKIHIIRSIMRQKSCFFFPSYRGSIHATQLIQTCIRNFSFWNIYKKWFNSYWNNDLLFVF